MRRWTISLFVCMINLCARGLAPWASIPSLCVLIVGETVSCLLYCAAPYCIGAEAGQGRAGSVSQELALTYQIPFLRHL